MDNITLTMRLMTHLDVGATPALLAWLAGAPHSIGVAHISERASVMPSPTAEEAAQ